MEHQNPVVGDCDGVQGPCPFSQIGCSKTGVNFNNGCMCLHAILFPTLGFITECDTVGSTTIKSAWLDINIASNVTDKMSAMEPVFVPVTKRIELWTPF